MRVESLIRVRNLSSLTIGCLLLIGLLPYAVGQFPSNDRRGPQLRLRTVEPEPAAPEPTAPAPKTTAPARNLVAAPKTTEPKSVKLEPLSFLGVQVGGATVDDASRAWGQPQKTTERDTVIQQTFAVEPFDRIEATFYRGVLLSATVILRDGLPIDEVVRRLDLTGITPVTLRDLNGKVSGRGYPERGVSLLFVNAGERNVQTLILDTLDAQPFVRRAEQHLSREPSRALVDTQAALQVDERSTRAWRMQAIALLRLDRPVEAAVAAEKAKAIEPDQPGPLLLLARALHAKGEREAAIEAAQQALKLADDRPEWKVAALVGIGDTYVDGPGTDSQRALTYYQQAVGAADALRNDPSADIRLVASEALIEAHLGAADAISRAQWQNKPQAVSRWLEQTVKLAQEAYAQDPDSLADAAFAVGVRATEIATRLDGQLDVRSWAEDCRSLADQRLAGVTDPADRRLITRELVTAYDSVAQSAQRRREPEIALQYAEQAVKLWQDVVAKQNVTSRDKQLLGQLNFRIGSCYAILKQDHEQAVEWFDKARPDLELATTGPSLREPGKLGETFVSMAVSYWTVGKHQPALDLTEQGLQWMEKAVENGQLDRATLKVPFNNLARMHQSRGNDTKAEEFQELAGKADGKTVR